MQLYSLEPLFKQLKFSTHLSVKIFLPGDLNLPGNCIQKWKSKASFWRNLSTGTAPKIC